jgi:hypothetical protein
VLALPGIIDSVSSVQGNQSQLIEERALHREFGVIIVELDMGRLARAGLEKTIFHLQRH